MTAGGGTDRLVCGLDLGGTKLLTVVTAPEADEPLLVTKTPRPDGDLIGGLAAATREAVDAAERVQPGGRVEAVGVGVAGLVDREGVLRYGPNLPGLTDVAVGPSLTDELGLPVVVDNDATCAGWAEHRKGSARGTRDSVTVTLGTGIGAGLVSAGAVLGGTHGFAGEPGHMTVDPHGPRCACGRVGCWEQFASGSALGRMGREAVAEGRGAAIVAAAGGDPDAVRGEHVSDAAVAGDGQAQAVLERFAWWVAVGVTNLINVLDPGIVVIGGGLSELGDLLLDPVRRAQADLLMGAAHREPVPIVAASLGERAGAWGAALLAAERLD